MQKGHATNKLLKFLCCHVTSKMWEVFDCKLINAFHLCDFLLSHLNTYITIYLNSLSFHNKGTGIIIASFELLVGFLTVGWYLDMVFMP